MEMKMMKEGSSEFIYSPEAKAVVKAVIGIKPGLTLTLNENQLSQTFMMLKSLFSPEMAGRANIPAAYKAFMDGHYEFRENAKRDPHRTKLTLDVIPGEAHVLSAAELEPVYHDLEKLTHRVALDMAMDLGLQ